MAENPDNVFSSESLDSDKADPIRFVGGVYVGKTGWLHNSKRFRGQNKYYVLVDLGHNCVKKSYVDISSIAPPHTDPTSFAEALLQQHPQVEKAVNDLCKMLAHFEIDSESRKSEVHQTFVSKLEDAINNQRRMGTKANWKKVEYSGMD